MADSKSEQQSWGLGLGIAPQLRSLRDLGVLLRQHPDQRRHLKRIITVGRKSPLEARMPWLAYDVIEWLELTITPNSRVFEYGGGGSTAFFADHAAEVVTVEHDPEWTAALQREFASTKKVSILAESSANNYDNYVARTDRYPPEYFDLIVVDGRERVRCLERSAAHVKPGGHLMLDDSDRERYAASREMFADWEMTVMNGVSPFKSVLGHTTIWRKPLTA